MSLGIGVPTSYIHTRTINSIVIAAKQNKVLLVSILAFNQNVALVNCQYIIWSRILEFNCCKSVARMYGLVINTGEFTVSGANIIAISPEVEASPSNHVCII